VADTARDRIAAIPGALTRTNIAQGGGTTLSRGGRLAAPLGLAIAPNGDVLTVNGGDGNIVETTRYGQQVAAKTLVADGAGDLFGIALAPRAGGVYFVNDAGSGVAANSLELLH
jgi:DNA-binding beta-propeller fold protein YncE